MDVKTLSGYWKESLGWLRASELKILVLLTLNNFVRSLKTMMIYFNWLIILNLIVTYLVIKSGIKAGLTLSSLTNYESLSYWTRFGTLDFIAVLLNIVMTFCYLLSARASLERKDLSYFARYYVPKFPWFLLFWLLGGKLVLMVMFFFMDAGNTLRDFFESFKRGLLVHIYFFPGLLCIYFLWSLIGLTFVGIFLLVPALISGLSGLALVYITYISMLCYLLAAVIFCLTMFLVYSFHAVMYSKIKHSHYQLFFSK